MHGSKRRFLISSLTVLSLPLCSKSYATEPSELQKKENDLRELSQKIELESSKLKANYQPFKNGTGNSECYKIQQQHSHSCSTFHPLTSSDSSKSNPLVNTIIDVYANRYQRASNPYEYFYKKGTAWAVSQANIYANNTLQKIPFLAQTTIGMNQTSGSSGSFYLDSLLKLKTFGSENDSDAKGIIFGQTRWSGDWGVEGSTLNTGIGARYKVSKFALIGLNGFWDYRMVPDTTSHSRFGIGWEAFYKDFELRNNWYFAGTGRKTISQANSTTTYERVVPGWDVEVAYRLPDYPQLALAVRAFRWDFVSRSDNSGIEGSINWQASPNWNFEFAASNEFATNPSNTLSNDDIYVSFRAKYTFNKVKYKKKDYDAINNTRLTLPVRRRYDVLLERYTKNTSTGWSALVETR